MTRGSGVIKSVRYYSSVCFIYGATLLFALYLFKPSLFNSSNAVASVPSLDSTPAQPVQLETQKPIVMGKPVWLTVPKIGLEIRVMEGHYNENDGSWTLRDGRIETYFAMPSALANDLGGNTIIYGHSNKHVFSPLVKLEPGDIAEVRTENGHVFRYVFVDQLTVTPEDTSIFTLEGTPKLILQTCTGNWYEQRGLHSFTLAETIPASTGVSGEQS